MKIQRERLLEIIKEEIDWAKTRVPQETVNEEGGVSQEVNSMLNSILRKVRSADYNETLIEVEEVLTRVIRLISKSGGALQEASGGIDSLIRKHQNNAKGAAMGLLDSAKEFAQMPSHEPASSVAWTVEKQARLIVDAMVEIEKLLDETQQATSPLQEGEEDPWEKLASMLQEAGSPQLSLPKDLVFEIIEYLQDMSGLKMKGGDFVAKRARELLAKMDTGDTGPGALQEGKNIK